jgi:uncharacterized protein YjbI with pentapeptide repeats
MANFMKYIIASLLVLSVFGLMVPNAFADVPDWVKNTAGWWAADAISETEFLNAIEFLVNKEIIQVSDTTSGKDGSGYVPSWIKNNAGWWADGQIDDSSFVLGLQWLISNGIIIVEEKLIHTDANFRVAFIGDQGHNPQAIAVLNLIKDEGAQMVLHQGDFDYDDVTIYGGDPDAWDKMISDVLGDDFPYFASVGGHDRLQWNGYQQKLYDRLKKNPDAECIGDLGVKSSCTYKGLFFIQVSPVFKGSGHSSFIENQLNNNDHIWRVCSWAKSMHNMQIGLKADKVGWEVYENCKNGAAIIATAQYHSYSRTKTLIDIENQIVDPEWFEPGKLRVKEGSTFVFVSGLGGKSIEVQERCLPTSYPYGCNGEWASIYTSDQSADFGALFCTFNTGGQPNKADCYFKNIQGKIIDKFTVTNFVGIDDTSSNLPEIDLANKDMSGRDLTGTVLIGADLSDTNLTGADLSGKYLADTILTGADLSNSNLTGADLSGKDLTGMILTGADLSNSNLTGADLSGKDLTGMILIGADLTDVDITGTILTGADLALTNLAGVDLSDKDLTGTILTGADLSNTNLAGVDLSVMDLTFANLSGHDLSSKDLTKTILTATNLTDTILPYGVLSGKNLVSTKFNGVDLSGKDLSHSNFQYADFDNANLEGANLADSTFIQVDFTKIKNKSLAGADLTYVSFAHSNLSGVDLSGTLLKAPNFWKTNLSGVDFTVVDSITAGSVFSDANLSNSNFEGVNLSPSEIFITVFENKAHLKNLHHNLIVNDLFSTPYIFIISKQVLENDLLVKYFIYNSFANANLENANFKNAKLWHANFNQANLTNADLSGSDLRKAFLGGADLSNANLFGANLDDAYTDENTILNCKNHPKCLNGQ